MAAITIRNLDQATKDALRVRAARNNRSMEEEARTILREAVGDRPGTRGIGTLIHEQFMTAGGVELSVPDRSERPRKPEYDA